MAAGTRAAVTVTTIAAGDPFTFEVVIRQGADETRHRVTMARVTFERLRGGAAAPDRCIAAAFWFLLDREPKEAILASFDVAIIARYFPEFEHRLPAYLQAAAEDGAPDAPPPIP